MASAKTAAVRAYAHEWSEQLFGDVRGIGVVRDVLTSDRSGGVTRILQGMLALAFEQGFLLATTLAGQEPRGAARGWVDELAAECSQPLQFGGHGPALRSSEQGARPRLSVSQALARLRELEAQATAPEAAPAGVD